MMQCASESQKNPSFQCLWHSLSVSSYEALYHGVCSSMVLQASEGLFEVVLGAVLPS